MATFDDFNAALRAGFTAAALIAGFASSTFTAGLIAGLTAALIAGLIEALIASFGANLRDNFVTVLVAITALREPPSPDFRAPLPLDRLKDIIPSNSRGRFL